MLLLLLAQLVLLGMGTLTAARKCSVVDVPISISARQGVFNIDLPKTSLDAITLVQNITQQGRNFSQIATSGYATVTGNYTISAQYCMPDQDTSNNPTVQLLTHGIGFDKSYWDLPYNNYNYSYVCTAVDQYKYHTVAIDRLGIGLSSHGEPLNEIQAPLEVAALAAITQKLRDGSFPGAAKPYQKVVHVGHSFGSAQTYTLANLYPHLTDGIVLTGFSTNGTFVPYFAAGANFVQAATNQPFRLGPYPEGTKHVPDADGDFDYRASPTPKALDYTAGYLTNSNVGATQFLFFYPKYFDQGILFAGESTKQPVTPGELLTLPALVPVNAYTGPVLVFTGSNDLPYCGGDCLATGDPSIPSIPSTVTKSFPQADFEAYIQPNTGHGLVFHYNSTAGYKAIQGYLAGKGLAAS